MVEAGTVDRDVRLHVYVTVVETQRAPTVGETANALGFAETDVRDAYLRLAEARLLVLEPGTLDVRMANPFSAVPTDFKVETVTRTHFGNCAWDALGIPAALREDARISTSCQDCSAPIVIRVEGGRVRDGGTVAHFAIPARDWWKDIVFT